MDGALQVGAAARPGCDASSTGCADERSGQVDEERKSQTEEVEEHVAACDDRATDARAEEGGASPQRGMVWWVGHGGCAQHGPS